MRAKRSGKIIWELNRCERSDPKMFWKNCHFFPSSRKVKVRLFIFFQKRTDYLFSAFSRPEYLFQKSASPPSESNACPLKEKNIVLAVHESIFSWKAETLQIFSDVIVICDDLDPVAQLKVKAK